MPELCRRLNLVLLRHLGNQRFEILVEPPGWFGLVFGNAIRGQEVDLRSASLFLDSFQTDALEHWDRQRPEPLKSGVWHEFDDQDAEHYLEATALFVHGLPMLAIESLGHDYEVRVQLFQKARNYVLQSQSLTLETQKNDILLHILQHLLRPPARELSQLLDHLRTMVSDARVQAEVDKAIAICARQNREIETCLYGFASEIEAMARVSRDPSDAPDLIEATRALVKAELDQFLSRSVGLSMESQVAPGASRCVGDRLRLDKMLSSLVNFVLRRAPQGSSINLEISQPDSGTLLLEVWESQASLSEDQVNAVLTEMLASRELVRKSAQALYFCKITIERWGGTLGYRQDGARGCWQVRLPSVPVPVVKPS